MRARSLILVLIGSLAVVFLRAQSPSPAALTGQITSTEEGSMEGVLVSARKDGSTIVTTVVSDNQGRYRFPAERLQPGHYSLRIRAVGYDLENPATVDVASGRPAAADLKLIKTRDLAAQPPDPLCPR